MDSSGCVTDRTGITIGNMVNPVGSHVASEIRAHRARRKMTRATLAQESGLGASTIARLENEERDFSLDQLIRLADAFGIAVADLLPPGDTRAAS